MQTHCMDIQQTKSGARYPCGRCYFCRIKHVDEWCYRWKKELESPDTIAAHWITLTYRPKDVPLDGNGRMTLKKQHVKTWIDSLKKHAKRHKYPAPKYMIVGEYGGKRYRPHYHVILTNIPQIEKICELWHYGKVHFGTPPDTNKVGYIADYVWKEKKIPQWEHDLREKEFTNSSRGIGECAIEPLKKFIKDNFLTAQLKLNGKTISPPRYYLKKILTEDEMMMRAAFTEVQIQNIEQNIEYDGRINGYSPRRKLLEYVEVKENTKKKRAAERLDI